MVAWLMPAESRSPSVWVVVLNWNGLADTLDCLRSLHQHDYPNTQILVVDNGSKDSEADEIERGPWTSRVVRMPENVGFAAGCNIGIRHALTCGADYVWLLNNDTVVEADCLRSLVQAAEEDPTIGLLSPVVYDYARREVVMFAGTVIDFDRLERVHLRSIADSSAENERGSLALWGTALLIRRAVVERIGLLDERYFAYVEDMDYSIRAVEAGYSTRLVTVAAAYHKEGQALGGVASPLREYLLARNFYLFWGSHLTGKQRRLYRIRYISWVLARALAARDNPTVARQSLNGAWDALRGHWGSWERSRPMPWALRAVIERWILAWHPYFWIRLLGGDLSGVVGEACRRLFRAARF